MLVLITINTAPIIFSFSLNVNFKGNEKEETLKIEIVKTGIEETE